MNYHYGQAPSQTPALPFTYQPPAGRFGVQPKAPPHHGIGAPVGFQRPQQPVGQPPVNQYAYLYNPAPPMSAQSQPAGIRSASEIYPSTSWSGAGAQSAPQHPLHAPQFAQQSFGGYMPGPGKGGKGKGKGWKRPGPSQAIANASNAIPLGKQRVFASSPEDSAPEARSEPERPAADHRPMRVVGRGRALTTPAWAKEQQSRPPGERTDERPPEPRLDYEKSEGRADHERPRIDERPRYDPDRAQTPTAASAPPRGQHGDSRRPIESFETSTETRSHRCERPDRLERPSDRQDRSEKPDDARSYRADRQDWSERPEAPRSYRSERPDVPEKPEAPRSYRSDRQERSERPEAPISYRSDRQERSEKPDESRSYRSDRLERSAKPEEARSYRSTGDESGRRRRSRTPQRRTRRESPIPSRARRQSPESRRRW